MKSNTANRRGLKKNISNNLQTSDITNEKFEIFGRKTRDEC